MTERRIAEAGNLYGGGREVALPRKRGRLVPLLAVVAAVLALAIAVGVLSQGGFWDELSQAWINFSVSRGFLFFDEGGSAPIAEETETENETGSESGSEAVTDGSVSETEQVMEENVEKQPDDESEETASEATVTLDLSEAEMGAGYVIDLTGGQYDVEAILAEGFVGGKPYYSEQPEILIIHTHTSESYWDADPDNEAHKVLRGVVAVGELIVSELNVRGVPAVHCTVIHDGGSKIDSYSKAADTLETMLEIYPSVRLVIDLHRLTETDGNGREIRTQSPIIDGCAQIRVTVGADGISPRDNIALALSLRRELNREGARICMPVVLSDSTLNGHLSTYYLKIDVGSRGNTTQQALLAGEYLAKTLAELMKTK
ncbi:MAG: stage II sporulation protein P [Clostridia bacterium]|nr:stage II sporulation protein P [Clostridia bacterium]